MASTVGLQPSGETETKEWGLREKEGESKRELGGDGCPKLLLRQFELGNRHHTLNWHPCYILDGHIQQVRQMAGKIILTADEFMRVEDEAGGTRGKELVLN